ncbi:MAG: hypothetical protein SGJ13_16570 [Actinomycetota bacterium]|nr:hypothetical protein [Actinomycetota bacterium]
MEAALEVPRTARAARTGVQTGALALAGLASLGAGAIHAAAMGVHNEHDQAVLAFGIVAAFQLGWGAAALTSSKRWVGVVGAVGNAAIFAGWVLAKTSGISFVDGLEASELVQWADGVAVALALLSVLGVIAVAVRGRRLLSSPTAFPIATVAIAAITVSAMVSAANGHAHAAGGDGHGNEATAAAAGDGHGDDHGDAPATDATVDHGDDHGDDHVDDHVEAVAKPYDPAEPIDLSGTDGVTPAQQAAAENLIASTLLDLPRWADPATAEAEGWQSIRDGATGYEHYINRSLIGDGRILDPDYPESLVYTVNRSTGQKELAAAMFMLEPGATLDNAPNVGGNLMQWHIHNNLCFTAPPDSRIAGLTNPDGTCNAPLVTGIQLPMVHVWIKSHPCGPFSALEGVGGGQIKEGEERLCDAAHGA